MIKYNSKLLKFAPWAIIPLFGLLYYSVLFIMSSTTEYRDGFNWIIVGLIGFQVTILWYFAKYRLKKTVDKDKPLNLTVFVSPDCKLRISTFSFRPTLLSTTIGFLFGLC